ncbi:hypothetical protein LTR37_000281 [Vermiconidia calcicola]|uniref:Uncharacterized protein n=1 Tax=Vermiconidia calcicola TaxID=1690605 RepID=A0ACC3P103_9PEZI|nr:hypothetical protein LTR37_000281 [Vermiconidia calcicola]
MADLRITTTTTSRYLDESIPRKTYLQRLAVFPKGSFHGGWSTFFRHSYQPFVILFTFPAVTYTALIYGTILAWFSVIVNVYSIYMTLPPYNFTSAGIGLMNLPPFIGGVVGSIYGGVLNDWVAVRLARRNNGIFEPEMRLWVALPPILILPASILLFGISTAKGLPWIVPCIGSGLFGFSMIALWDVALTYNMDCYVEIIGDSLIGICFIRNAFATIIAVTITYWIEGMGLINMHIMVAVISFATALTTIPMMIYGKSARRWTEGRLDKMSKRQFGTRG